MNLFFAANYVLYLRLAHEGVAVDIVARSVVRWAI